MVLFSQIIIFTSKNIDLLILILLVLLLGQYYLVSTFESLFQVWSKSEIFREVKQSKPDEKVFK